LARHGITDAEIAGIIERMNEAISEEWLGMEQLEILGR
jgi:hypothetical protein